MRLHWGAPRYYRKIIGKITSNNENCCIFVVWKLSIFLYLAIGNNYANGLKATTTLRNNVGCFAVVRRMYLKGYSLTLK